MLIRTAFLAAGFLAATVSTFSQTTLKALSTDASLVTGGDVLVQLHTLAAKPSVTLNGTDVSRVFHAQGQGNYLALVTGLRNGTNTLRSGTASLTLTNYPIEGPVFSGPRITPFICQTNDFKLPDGTTLGKPLDENCSARTVVQYVYLPKNSLQFKPMKDLTKVPRDVAITTTASGNTVNFIVRVETGTMDRGIYQNAVLHDPTSEAQPTPFAPPRGWNHHLIALQGSGCPGGWYVQGAALGVSTLDRERLAQGDALFSNTLNHTSNSCNAILAGEATAMGKEHFIETFGVPDWTISIGGSGGAYTSLQIADALPGLIDGVMIRATFPDALAIALAGLDAHLLMHYFQSTAPLALTGVQQAAIGGYPSVDAMIDAANQAQRTDPVPHRDDIKGYLSAMWKDAVPRSLRYDPEKNPTGARPTIFDWARNAYGVDPQTGFALRPFDNTGVQYGLSALNRGVITTTQFLDLNEKIGGVDNDSNYIPSRTQGNLDAIRRTYQSGLMLSGGGGLASIPIVDDGTSKETGGYHYGWFHFALRDRVRQANGSSANMVFWRNIVTDAASQDLLNHWITAYKGDTRPGTQRDKVLRNKPSTGVDGCFTEGRFTRDELVFQDASSPCQHDYPVYSNARHEAGGPLAGNVLKCTLKPVDPADYKVSFSADDLARLKTIFPNGVCDWSKPGINQVPLIPWPSFGPSPKNLIYLPPAVENPAKTLK